MWLLIIKLRKLHCWVWVKKKLKSVNTWQSCKQERDCLVRLAYTQDGESAWNNHVLRLATLPNVAPACRPPRRRQLRLAATRSDVVSHTKCKTHCGLLHMTKQTFFTKSHATTVIYRLTVQTWPDGLETQIQFTPPDTTQTGPSCLVWRAVWTEH